MQRSMKGLLVAFAFASALVACVPPAGEATQSFSWHGAIIPPPLPPCGDGEYQAHAEISSVSLPGGGRRVTGITAHVETPLLEKGEGNMAAIVHLRLGAKFVRNVTLVAQLQQGPVTDRGAPRTPRLVLPAGTTLDVPKDAILLFESSGEVRLDGHNCPLPVAYAEFAF